MKRILAALTALFYLYGFTFCLCYAVVMGEIHPVAPTAPAAHSPAQDDEDSENCSHHDQAHHGRDSSAGCCVKFLQDTPGLLPEASSGPLPTPTSSLHIQPLSLVCLNLWQHISFYRIHAPPEAALQDPLVSFLGPRAPPLPA